MYSEPQDLQPETCQGLPSGLWIVLSLPLPQRDQVHTITGQLSPSSEDRKMPALSRQMDGSIHFIACHFSITIPEVRRHQETVQFRGEARSPSWAAVWPSGLCESPVLHAFQSPLITSQLCTEAQGMCALGRPSLQILNWAPASL